MPETSDSTQPVSPVQIKGWDKASPSDRLDLEKRLLDKHIKRFTAWETWRRPFENLWTEAYTLYLTVFRGNKIPTRARVVIPIIFQVIEAAIPKLVSIIFGQSQFFDVVSRNQQNKVPPEILENVRALLEYELDLAGFFTKFVEFAKQLLLYGTSYLFVYWKVRREWVYERESARVPRTIFGIPLGTELVWTKTLSYKVVERRPEVDVLDIADVYPDPEARCEDSSTGLYVTSTVTMDDLKEMSSGKYPIYANYEQVEAQKAEYKAPQFKLDRRAIRGTGEPTVGAQNDEQVELLTFWGKEDLDGDGVREEVQIVIANRRVIVKATRNPFEHQERPIIRSVLFPVPLEWYGIGLIEPVIPMVHELNTIRCQQIDMNNLIINRMWKVNTLADVDLDTLISAPNGIILTDMMDGVSPIDQPALPFSPIQNSEMIQRDIENTTAPKSIQGSPDSGALGRTARGAQLIIQQALEKFGMGAKLIEESAVRRVLSLFHKLNAQFLDSDDIINEFYGDIFSIPITPEQIRADINFKMLGVSETVTKEAMINQLLAFVNTFKGLPGINLIELAKVMWNLMQLKEPADKVIQELPPEAMAMMGQMQPPAVAEGGSAEVVNQALQNGSAAPTQVPQGGM